MAVNRRLRSGSASLLVSVAVLGVLVALNVLASRTTLAWDMTRSGINTLAPQSALAAKRLDADMLVIGLFRAGPGNGQAEAESLVGLYEAKSSRVVYRGENFDRDLADVRKYSVREPNTLVLDYRGKTHLLTQTLQTEQDFTTALLKLEADHVPVVCWAAGAGGRSRTDTSAKGYSSVADILARNNFQTRDVLVPELTSVPSDCDEMALVAPTVALSSSSVKALDDYLVAGGNLLIVGDPWSQTPAATASLSEVLKPFGLGFSGALVVEPDTARAFDAITPAVLDYGRSPITRDIQGIASFFPQTTAITGVPVASAAAVVIGATTTRSYAVTTPRADLARQAADTPGPFVIMETLEAPAGEKKARIAMVGTSGFAENRVLPPSSNDANLELVLGTFQWLAREDSLISIPPKAARALPLTLTQQDQGTIIFITIFLMPALIVFAGVMVWWRRRLIR
jgi:ABC-2 type transport system permease protein